MSTWPAACFLDEFGNGVAFMREAFNAVIPTPCLVVLLCSWCMLGSRL